MLSAELYFRRSTDTYVLWMEQFRAQVEAYVLVWEGLWLPSVSGALSSLEGETKACQSQYWMICLSSPGHACRCCRMNLFTAAFYLLLQRMNTTANQGENESQTDSLIVRFSVSEKNRRRLVLYQIPPNPSLITHNFSSSLPDEQHSWCSDSPWPQRVMHCCSWVWQMPL